MLRDQFEGGSLEDFEKLRPFLSYQIDEDSPDVLQSPRCATVSASMSILRSALRLAVIN